MKPTLIHTLTALEVSTCLFLACFAGEAASAPDHESGASVRGAIYIPAEAYNAPQMWKNFSLAETRRDFGYAQRINLNALRIWASYEYWQNAAAIPPRQ